VFVLLPSAVPTTGGSAPPSPTGAGAATAGVSLPVTSENPESQPDGSSSAEPGTGDIFGSGENNSPKSRIPLSNPATSPLNLIGKIEGWGIGPATRVSEVSIKLPAATGAQLKELLKRLPESLIFELNLEKEDD